jgi:polysaccharide deacetylase family protein (PEP-CTERM system associated)
MVHNVISVDVEEFYHAEIFRRGLGSKRPATFESRVERSVDDLLTLFDRHGARGTFFVLGDVAVRHPKLVRRILAFGHEIASHGDAHESVSRQTSLEFRVDIRIAKARLEDVIGQRVIGYRAPNFSIGPDQPWAFPILAEEGFEYDSSVFPIVHDRYGQPDAPRVPYIAWRDRSSYLVEFPIGTVRLGGINLPMSGGGYFRLLPFALTRAGIQRVNLRERQPVMFYLHPWEIDGGQPRPPMPWRYRTRHYVGIEGLPDKLDRLLSHFAFDTARDVLERYGVRPLHLEAAPPATTLATPA